MAKTIDKELVIQNKKEAIKQVNKLLEFYITEPSGKYLKKANLISYWLKEYARYIDFEDKFEPSRNIAYKRGNVIKVNFGFNVGNEYGGLHYAVVLDNKNEHRSPVVTVIPLTSFADDKTVHHNSVMLGNDIYKMLKVKYDTTLKALEDEENEIIKSHAAINALLSIARNALDDIKSTDENDAAHEKMLEVERCIEKVNLLDDSWQEKAKHNKQQKEYLDKIGAEIKNMKKGSVALVNQITTISKMRIFDPKNAKGVLSGISLSEENMGKINNKIKELFVF